ncbi:MAG: hypothetical protein ABI743_08000 [bacterium]
MSAARHLLALPALVLLTLLGTACGDVATTPPDPNTGFGYTPLVAGYLTSADAEDLPLSGAWRLAINASTNGVVTAKTLSFLTFTPGSNRALAFIPSRNGSEAFYIDSTLTGSDLKVVMESWDPGADRDSHYVFRGSLDLGDGTLTNGTYTAQIRTGGTGRSAAGEWRLDIEDIHDLDLFEPTDNGIPAAINFTANDSDGRGFVVAKGTLDIELDGNTVTGTMTVTVKSKTGTTLATADLDVEGARVGDYIAFNVSGTDSGITFEGSAKVKLIDPTSDSLFDEDGLASGGLVLNTTGPLNSPLHDESFAGVVGQGLTV